MANITRFDPLHDFDDLFKGFFVRPLRLGAEELPAMQIKLDVSRQDDTYAVKAEMPGVSKDDIDIAIDGNQITISGEVKKEKEEKKGEEVIRSERYFGRISRSFTLPQEVDDARAVAKYADGVLQLTLPTKAKSTSTKVKVS